MTTPYETLAEAAELAERATPGPWSFDAFDEEHSRDGTRYQCIQAVGGENPACGQAVAETYHQKGYYAEPGPLCPDGELVPNRNGRIEDARFIIACHPDNVRAWKAEMDRLRADLIAIAQAPFPLHDYCSRETWERTCRLVADSTPSRSGSNG